MHFRFLCLFTFTTFHEGIDRSSNDNHKLKAEIYSSVYYDDDLCDDSDYDPRDNHDGFRTIPLLQVLVQNNNRQTKDKQRPTKT